RVHTSGPVTAEVIAPGGKVVRELGRLPHPNGRVVAVWNGRESGGRVAADGSYRLKVSLSGRDIELLNPLALDTAVRVQSTHVSRRVISPDCDSYGNRVTVVVRGNEQLAGLALQVRQGSRLLRTVRVKSRARALAISWPPRAGKRCTTAPGGRYRLRVVARDVPGNSRAVELGAITARGVALSPPDRSIVAGRRVRIGISADARSLRLELARLGDGAPQVLARGTRARLHRLQSPCWAHVPDVARSARRACRARRPAGQPAARFRVAALPAAAGRSWHPLRRDHAQRPTRGCARRLQGRRRACGRRRRGRALGIPARDQCRRNQARARLVIPAAYALVGTTGVAG